MRRSSSGFRQSSPARLGDLSEASPPVTSALSSVATSARPRAAGRRLLAWTGSRSGEILFALAASALAGGLAALVLEVWRGPLSVPFEYSLDDANYQLMLVKATLEHGSWFTNPALGAPFGQELYDFAVGGDNLHFLLIRLLGLFSSDAAVVANLFFLLSFPLAALSAFVVMRWAGASRVAALVCSVLYALTPYHFLRGEHHAFLAADYAVPLGCYLALAVAAGRPLFPARPDARARWARRMSSRSLLSLGACIAVASSGNVYYAAFTLLLVAGAALVRLAAQRDAKSLAGPPVAIGLILAVLAVNLAPTMIYASRHGRNEVVALRAPEESKQGGFTLGQLLLPLAHHRIEPLGRVHRRYEASGTPPRGNESYGGSLGVVGAVGFLWLLGMGLVRLLGRRPALVRQLSGEAAVVAILAFLIGTIGAGGALVAYLVTPQIRAWNRLSIFIAFLSLLGVAYLLDRLVARAGRVPPGRVRAGRVGVAALAGCVLVVGALDQTSPAFAPSYSSLHRAYSRDASFVASIERRLPRGAQVFELPYIPFPEALPFGRVNSYDPLVGYLHSRDLRWSYGAMKGRPQDWPQALASRPLELSVMAVAAAGFDGLLLDRAGYGSSQRQVLARLQRTSGARPLQSEDGRRAFFDLRALRDRLRRRLGPARLAAVRDVTLLPTRVAAGAGISGAAERSAKGERTWWVVSRHAKLLLVNPARAPRRVVFSAVLHTSRRAPVGVTFPGAPTRRAAGTPGGVRIERKLLLPPGESSLALSIGSAPIRAPGDARRLYMRIGNPSFTELPLSWLRPGPRSRPARARPGRRL